MPKYKYYITDLMEGLVRGTNDKEIASNYAMSEDHYVVDAEEGKWLSYDGSLNEVEEV